MLAKLEYVLYAVLLIGMGVAYAVAQQPADPAPPSSRPTPAAAKPSVAVTTPASEPAASEPDSDAVSTINTPSGVVSLYGKSTTTLNADSSISVAMPDKQFNVKLRLDGKMSLETAAWTVETDGFIVRDRTGAKVIEVAGVGE